MGKSKPKLFYILPAYDSQAPTHYVHIFELLEKLGEKIDIFLLIEKSNSKPTICNVKKIYSQKITWPIFNLIERFFLILFVRIQGYKRAYVHYSYWGAMLSAIVFRLSKGQVYYWHCEVYNHFFSKFSWDLRSLKKKITDEYLLVLSLKMVNFLVTGTPKVKDYYKNEFNLKDEKIKIIPNWVNLERFKSNKRKLKTRRKLVLFAHKFVARKGADYLPAIIEKVSQEIPDVSFILLGPGDFKPIVDEIKRRGHLFWVEKIGAVANWEIPEYLAQAEIFIMPSRQEGFPRVLIEAMAGGVSFVATDVGGTRDILSPMQNKFLVPAGNMDLFCEKLIYLLKNAKLRSALIADGRKQVQKYSLEKVKKVFFKEIIQKL